LDLDTKRSKAPRHISMTRLLEKARSLGLMTEISHSKRGAHIFFLADSDPTLPKKILVAEGQEIEIFGHETGAGKSVMLTGDKLAGEVLELNCSVREFLAECGIEIKEPVQEQLKPAPSAMPMRSLPLQTTDMDKAANALRFVQCDGYDTWIAIGQALQSEFQEQGFHLWVQWSATQPSWESEEDCFTHWKSFKTDKGISIGTLFHMAKLNGYKPQTKSEERSSAHEDFQIKLTSIDSQLNKNPKIKGKGPLSSDHVSLLDPDSIMAESEHVQWLVEGFLERQALGMIWGPPASFKSFIALDWALCVATGTPWFGQPVTQGPVFYIAGEGRRGIRKRISAWLTANGMPIDKLPGEFYMSRGAVNARSLKFAEALVDMSKTTGKPLLVVIDTLNRNFGGGDENSATDVGMLLDVCDRALGQVLGATVLIVHHATKDGNGYRGSSALRGGMDFEFEVRREGMSAELVSHKVKDGPELPTFVIDLEVLNEFED